jgi:arsenate reductase
MISVLVLCTGNSARSQMAEGLLRVMGKGMVEVESAGTHPSIVREEAIAALAEIGIDIAGNRSKSIDEFAGREFDFVLTVCDSARENCPWFPASASVIHHSFEDPAACEGVYEERLALFRRVRDEIKDYFEREFLSSIGIN